MHNKHRRPWRTVRTGDYDNAEDDNVAQASSGSRRSDKCPESDVTLQHEAAGIERSRETHQASRCKLHLFPIRCDLHWRGLPFSGHQWPNGDDKPTASPQSGDNERRRRAGDQPTVGPKPDTTQTTESKRRQLGARQRHRQRRRRATNDRRRGRGLPYGRRRKRPCRSRTTIERRLL